MASLITQYLVLRVLVANYTMFSMTSTDMASLITQYLVLRVLVANYTMFSMTSTIS